MPRNPRSTALRIRPEADHDARQGWRRRLQTAIDDEQFVLHAQPIVPVCSNDVPRFELLLRLPDDHGELIAPRTFLRYAERFDLTEAIDNWVMSQAIEHLHEYHTRGLDICLAINLSGQTLNRGKIGERLRELLETHEIPTDRLVVELTETAAVAHIERAQELGRCVRQLGCCLALDDFAAESATIDYLKYLDFDYIKIDGELIKRLPQTYADQLVVRALVDIARGLGTDTIAKSVQDDKTLGLLHQLGVGYAQGYHTGRAGPLRETLPEFDQRADPEHASGDHRASPNSRLGDAPASRHDDQVATTDGDRSTAPVRVAIADDDPLARLAVGAMIDHTDGLALVGAATGVEDIAYVAALTQPDVIVLDWMMPGGGGPEAARRIRERQPNAAIVGLTSSRSPKAFEEMTSHGASRLLLKGCSVAELAHAIVQAAGDNQSGRRAH